MYLILSNERPGAHRSARFKCFLFLGEEPLLKGTLIREKTASIYPRNEERRGEARSVFEIFNLDCLYVRPSCAVLGFSGQPRSVLVSLLNADSSQFKVTTISTRSIHYDFVLVKMSETLFGHSGRVSASLNAFQTRVYWEVH